MLEFIVRLFPRLIFALLGLTAAAWGYDLWQTAREREEFKATQQARSVSHKGPFAPADPQEYISAHLAYRSAQRQRDEVVMWGVFGTVACVVVGAIATLVLIALRTREREAIDRPAFPTAGEALAALVRNGGKLIATATHRLPLLYASKQQAIEIDAHARKVNFRNYRFQDSFYFPPVTPVRELAFADILVARFRYHHSSPSLVLRTTAGTVIVSHNLSDFRTLVGLFGDIEESNRGDLERYRAARAREPQIRIPKQFLLLAGAGLVTLVILVLFVQSI